MTQNKDNDELRYIYALIDPRDNTVRYIGCAVNPEQRLKQHLKDKKYLPKNKWLAELRANNLSPELEVLEEIQGFLLAYEREDDWIAKMLHQGEPLTNVVSTTQQGHFRQNKASLKPFLLKGTELLRIRRELGIKRDIIIAMTELTPSAYRRAEEGSKVSYDTAQKILLALNDLLRMHNRPETTLTGLGWTAC